MMTWIRGEYQFPIHGAVLTVSQREMAVFARTRGVLEKFPTGESPEEVEKLLTAMIAEYRPDLTGGQLIGIHTGAGSFLVELTYLHPSLPENELGFNWHRQPLRVDEGMIILPTIIEPE